MERKKKECKGCGELSFLWARGRCKLCDQRDNPEKHGAQTLNKATGGLNSPSRTNTPPKARKSYKRSKKRERQESKYRNVRDKYLADHPICEFPGCGSREVTLHHMKGRIGSLLHDKRYFKALCWPHHQWVELNPDEAKRMGLSLSRLSND